MKLYSSYRESFPANYSVNRAFIESGDGALYSRTGRVRKSSPPIYAALSIISSGQTDDTDKVSSRGRAAIRKIIRSKLGGDN